MSDNESGSRKIPTHLTLGSLLLLISHGTLAAPNYTLGYSALYDSNFRLDESDQSNTEHTVTAQATAQLTSGRVNTIADLALGYTNSNTVDDSLEGTGGLNIDIAIRPRRFSWTISNVLSETLIDASQSSIDPDNSDLRNTFSTGPSLTFRVTPRITLDIDGRFRRTKNFEQETADTEESEGNLQLTRAFSNRSEGGLDYAYVESELIDDALESIDTREVLESAGIFYNISLSRLDIEAAAGYDREVRTGFDSEAGSLNLGYQLTRTLRLNASGSKALTTDAASDDAGLASEVDRFRQIQDACSSGSASSSDCRLINRLTGEGRIGTGDLLGENDFISSLFTSSSGVFENERYSAGLSWTRDNTSVSVTVFEAERTDVLPDAFASLLEPDREEVQGASLSATFAVGRRSSLGFGVTVSERDSFIYDTVTLAESVSTNEEMNTALSFNYALRSNINTTTILGYSDSERTSIEGVTQEGDGYSVGFSLTWAL